MPGVSHRPLTAELALRFPPSDFSELDTLDAPVFFGRCFFGRNNLGEYPDEKFGINCQCHGYEEVRISDGILGRVFNNDRADYSFALVYAENEVSAQVDILGRRSGSPVRRHHPGWRTAARRSTVSVAAGTSSVPDTLEPPPIVPCPIAAAGAPNQHENRRRRGPAPPRQSPDVSA